MTDTRMQRLLNESEIRSVLIRERFHRDHGEWEEWRQTYHPDSGKTEVHTSLYHGDIDGFIELTKNTPHSFFESFHTVSPAVIDIHGNKALTKSLATVNASFQLESHRYDCVVDVIMITRLEYSPEGWRITTREGVYRRDRIVPATPSEFVDEVNRPERRMVNRNLDWLAEYGGRSFDRSVLGFDDPQKLNAFVEAGYKWLNL